MACVQRQLHLWPVVEVERSEARRSVLGVVDGELSGSEVLVPVGLLEVDAGAQHLLRGAVGSLGLAVGLRVVRRAHRERGAELRPEGAPEVSGEARITVAEDGLGHAVESHHLPHEERGQLRCGDGRRGGDVVHHLGQLVDEHHDGVVAGARARQLRDEVHAHLLPRASREWAAAAAGPSAPAGSACCAGTHRSWSRTARSLVHARPVEASLHLLDGLVLAEVTARRRVVALLQDARLQREVGRDVQARPP